jgi:hypothetical protein
LTHRLPSAILALGRAVTTVWHKSLGRFFSALRQIDLVDVLSLLGAGWIVAGTWQIAEPLGKIVLGSLLLIGGFIMAMRAQIPNR